MAGRDTPVMQQHARAKRAYPGAIVFFRLGDFYEMFGQDAVEAAGLLELTLTSRNKGKPDEVPMAGVPHHSAHVYIARLLALGRSVALCEQLADPAKTRGLVPREVTRVLTPGLVTAEEYLTDARHHWLAVVELVDAAVGIALLDLSTGTLEAAELGDLSAALAELASAEPRELLLAGSAELRASAEQALGLVLPKVSLRADVELSEREAQAELDELLRDAAALGPLAQRAAARALRHARACNPGVELPVRRLGRWSPDVHLALDATAQAHLELTHGASGDDGTSLLTVLDHTSSPAGARLLRRRLLAPLRDVARIRRRLDAVESLVNAEALREALSKVLRGLGDLERVVTRASFGEASPRDLGVLRDGLAVAARAVELLSELPPQEQQLHGLSEEQPVELLPELRELLTRALIDQPPPRLAEGAGLRVGFDAELDRLQALAQQGAEHMVALEERLRQQTGIGSLKVRYTRVFGWYIEVSRSKGDKVPGDFRRKQTVAAGERYTTVELDELAEQVASADERYRELSLQRFRELLAAVRAAEAPVRALVERCARWDVSASLATVAHRFDYVRPQVDDGTELDVRDGRHPVVERLAARGRFVPNDVSLSVDGERLWLVTGPNMAGKSTLLRQTALQVILAQMGSFVPARAARIGVVDRVCSRVGASDDLARGESTFMVEMRETAEILRVATRRSLVILDEIGRGTSTYDGLAIAWGVAEHLERAIGCRTLFATHYHELTALAESSRHVANVSVSAREQGEEVVFLHRLVRGAASRSYGVAVARLAGLPESVLARARALLAKLEAGEGPRTLGSEPAKRQLGLFGPSAATAALEAELTATLRETDVDRLTGLDALALIAKLKAKLR